MDLLRAGGKMNTHNKEVIQSRPDLELILS